MLGFRGHFSTKTRRYSTTLGCLRSARQQWRSAHILDAHGLDPATPVARLTVQDLDDLFTLDHYNETVLVVGHWRYAGRGHSPGEARVRGHYRRRPGGKQTPVETGSNRPVGGLMEELRCDWCDAPADIVDNYDTLLCLECWDEAGRDKPHNLIFRVLRNRDEGDLCPHDAIDETAGEGDRHDYA